jgi:hypothetical protein
VEVLLIAAAGARGLIGVDHLQKSKAGGSAGGTGPGDPGWTGGGAGGGTTDGGGGSSGNSGGPPALPPVTGPGVYPPNTPGAFPLTVEVMGGDCDSWVSANPGSNPTSAGGTTGPCAGKQVFWYGPGTWVIFTARVDAFGPAWLPQPTKFDHWEGPGGERSPLNPIRLQINGQGFVRGVFAWLGHVG